MRLTALRREHLQELKLQSAQAYLGADLTAPGYFEMLMAGQAFTGMVGDTVIGCAGCIEQWDNRSIAWALVSAHAGRHMVGVHRAVAGFLAQARWRRVETFVDAEFAEGHRWMGMLGFAHEGRMTAFSPDGRDFDLYARVRKC